MKLESEGVLMNVISAVFRIRNAVSWHNLEESVALQCAILFLLELSLVL